MKTPENVKWTTAEKGEGLSIVYHDKEGSKMIRRKDPTKGSLKGSKAWRHNNPGNLSFGPHARLYGAIGSAKYIEIDEKGKEKEYIFAIFPNRDKGHAAMIALLKEERFSTLSLYESIREGDVPSERWFIYPNELSMKYLRESGVFETIPENYRPIIDDWKRHVNSIQLAANGELEREFGKRDDQEVELEGWLGSWPTHCYSVFFFEVVKIN